MTRISRMVVKNEPVVYHVMPHTALEGFPFQEAENDELERIIKVRQTLYYRSV